MWWSKGTREGRFQKRDGVCLTGGAMWEKGPVVGMGATMTERGGETGGQPRWVMERIISAF